MEMNNQFQPYGNTGSPSARLKNVSWMLWHPDEVLSHPKLDLDEKRALLASWASDVHAVPGTPSLRHLDSGAIVNVDDILQALKALDNESGASKNVAGARLRLPFQRRLHAVLRPPARTRWRRDEDDDPPPCPASAAIPPRKGGDAGCECVAAVNA
jgi:hypothetical protein